MDLIVLEVSWWLLDGGRVRWTRDLVCALVSSKASHWADFVVAFITGQQRRKTCCHFLHVEAGNYASGLLLPSAARHLGYLWLAWST